MTGDHLIVFPEFRAAHARHADEWTDSTIGYFDLKWDIQGTPLPPNTRKVRALRLALDILRRPPAVLELAEPLFIRELPRSTLLATAAHVAGWFRSRRPTVVAYAIENNDLIALVGRVPAQRLVARVVRRVLRWLVMPLYDRVAFGTPGARDQYLAIAPALEERSALVLELPVAAPTAQEPRPGAVVFVGELDERKGIRELMDAWPSVENADAAAVLTIVGRGQHAAAVREFADGRLATRRFLGQLPHEDAVKEIGRATVLVAPSRRAGRWREQVGRPISEALAHGLTVVTTEETGLADWLVQHGHCVLNGAEPSQLAQALTKSLLDPLPREQVFAALPDAHGRDLAHKWLHRGDGLSLSRAESAEP